MLKYLMYRSIMGLTGLLPRFVQYFISQILADLHYLLDVPAREAVKANMRIILGHEAPESIVCYEARWVFRSFGMYLCEFFGYRRFGDRYLDEHVAVQGREHLDAALAKGRGALFVSAHYSNWEIGASVVARMGYPILAITQMHPEPRVNELFVQQRRNKGVEVRHSEHGAIATLHALRDNKTVALLGDRRTGGPTIPVQLFGRIKHLPQGPWRLAVSSGAALLPTFVHRRFNRSYTLQIGAALQIPATGTRDEKAQALANAWAKVFEERLRADPSQWEAFYPAWPPTVGLSISTHSAQVSLPQQSIQTAEVHREDRA